MAAERVDVFLPDYSQYGVLHYFTRHLYEALKRTGLSCRLLEGNDCITQPLISPPTFTIAFNGVVFFEGNSLLCDWIQVPHIACMLDPPYGFFPLMKSPFIIVTCDDLNSCQLLKRTGFKRAVFMPHAVEKELSPDPNLERIYDITFQGTYIDCEAHRASWPQKYPAAICQAMEEVVDLALHTPTSFIKIINETFSSPELFNYPVEEIFKEIELYIKGRDRLDLLDAIKNHPIHIFGASIDQKGWKDFASTRPNLIVHDPLEYDEAVKVMKQSKIVLNSSLKNQYGAHERVFAGPACGAVAVTNDNEYLRKNFTDGKDIILFQRNHWNALKQQIDLVLADESHRQKMAEAARKNVMSNHTWDHRVKQLLKEVLPTIRKINAQK